MISSAVGGKRAAPKTAVRRRPPTKSQHVSLADDTPIEAERSAPLVPTTAPTRDATSVSAALSEPPYVSVGTPLQSEAAPRVETQREVSATAPVISDSPAARDGHDQSDRNQQLHVLDSGADGLPISVSRVESQDCFSATGQNKRKRAPGETGTLPGNDTSRIASLDVEAPKPRRPKRKAKKTKTTSEGKERADESKEVPGVDPANLTMFQLSYNNRHGKSSERERKMAEIDWVEVGRKRQEEVDKIRAGQNVDRSNADQVVESTESANGQASVTPAARNDDEGTGIGLRIVNGQIVEDETTLSIDQNAQAQANATNDDEVEEENDLAERLNRTTFLNNRRRDPRERIPVYKSKSDPWTEDETDRFYEALRMFGTDFDIISKMFPPKTRMQVKKKFNREERIDLPRINAALLGKENKPMDLEHYAREVGEDVSVYMKYESYEHASQIIRESMKDREEELAAAVKENTETQRQQDIQQKQQEAAEKKKMEKKEKAAARRANKGRKPGVGTMGGGGPEDVVVETTES
nr:transcription factor tfiiib component b'' [Quercus suber]